MSAWIHELKAGPDVRPFREQLADFNDRVAAFFAELSTPHELLVRERVPPNEMMAHYDVPPVMLGALHIEAFPVYPAGQRLNEDLRRAYLAEFVDLYARTRTRGVMVIMSNLWNGANRVTVAMAMGQLILATTPALAQGRRDFVALDRQFTVETSAPLSTEPWWETLGDPLLRQYVEDALTGNYDLAAATHRIAQAEATAVRARAPILPSLSLDAQGSTGPLSTLGFVLGGIPRGGGVSLPTLFYTGNATLNLRYRLDAWGQEYLAYQASKLQAMASRGDRDGVALALISQIAEAYLNAVMAKQQIAIIERQIEASRQLEALTQRRFEVGEATALTVLQQRQQLASTRANLPPTRQAYRVSVQQLAVLIGRRSSRAVLAVADSLPPLPPEPGLGTPEDLLTNRPDLRAANHRVRAADKQAGSARLVHLPSVDLSANAGYQVFSGLETNEQTFWGATVNIAVPIFRGFDNVSQVREAAAAARTADATLQQLLLEAIDAVEVGLVQEQEQRAQLGAFSEQFAASRNAFQESRRRYIAGLAAYLDMLTALNTMQQAELNVVRARRNTVSARIQLRQALGGPWAVDLIGRARRER